MHETMHSGPQVSRSMHTATGNVQSALDGFGEKSDSERDLTSDLVTSRDAEARPQVPEKRRSSTDEDDPFGDEENSEVKYRTLKWW